jgi:hypothetical protein
VDNGFFTMNFIREGLKLVSYTLYTRSTTRVRYEINAHVMPSIKFKGWFENLLESSWKACQGTDVLIESPSAMVGVHMAEKLGKF